MMIARRLAIGLSALLLMSGCSAGGDQPPPSTTSQASVSTLQGAIDQTRAAESADVTVELLTTVDGVDDAISGQGVVSFDRDLGEMRWTSTAGPSVERRTADGVFVQFDAPDGSWVRAPRGTPTSGTMTPLRGLDDLQDVRASGTEPLSIGDTTRFTGTLPAVPYVADMGLNPIAAEAVAADEHAGIDVTVWVDREGRVRRIMRTLRTSLPIAAATFTDLVEFGVPIEVRTPTDYDTAT